MAAQGERMDETPHGSALARVWREGLKAVAGAWQITDSGVLLTVLDAPRLGRDAFAWFEWDGARRRLHALDPVKPDPDLLGYLDNAWPLGADATLAAEADRHLAACLGYEPERDRFLVAANFDLLRAQTARILSTSAMRNGALGTLSIGSPYGGVKRYPVSSLLEAWTRGEMRVACPNAQSGTAAHQAFVISGGGMLSTGLLHAYCPECRKAVESSEWSLGYLMQARTLLRERSDGFRLDEIIEALSGDSRR